MNFFSEVCGMFHKSLETITLCTAFAGYEVEKLHFNTILKLTPDKLNFQMIFLLLSIFYNIFEGVQLFWIHDLRGVHADIFKILYYV